MNNARMLARVLTPILASSLALATGCATAPVASTRAIPADLQIGGLAQRTNFEQQPTSTTASGSSQPADDAPDSEKKQRRRKVLYFLGLGAAGFGVVSTAGFGIGGRVVQGKLSNGYDDGSLSRADEDRLTSTGETMNGLTIGSAVIGLAGALLAATVYGIDHSKCGELPPRRKRCPGKADPEPAETQTAEPAAEPAAEPSAEPAAQ